MITITKLYYFFVSYDYYNKTIIFLFLMITITKLYYFPNNRKWCVAVNELDNFSVTMFQLYNG